MFGGPSPEPDRRRARLRKPEGLPRACGELFGAVRATRPDLPCMHHKACHFEITIKNRGNCTSIVGAAAYRAGACYHDARTGRRCSYAARRDVASVEMIRGPKDPEEFWNTVDAAETRKNARLAREFVISLPAELPLDNQRRLVRGFCLWLHDRYKLTSMAAIHHPFADGLDREITQDLMLNRDQNRRSTDRQSDRGNPLNHHVHILTPTREWNPDTDTLGPKLRALDDRKTGPLIVQQCRNEWQRRVNVVLEKHGVAARVDLRSYEKMAAAGEAPDGLIAQRKLGPKNTARGRKVERETGQDSSYSGQRRQKVREHNDALWQSWLQLRALEREKARLERSAALAAEREETRRKEAAVAQALEDAPHLDCLDPKAQAIAWAKGENESAIDAQFDRQIDPETEDATEPTTAKPPLSTPVKRPERPVRQRIRK